MRWWAGLDRVVVLLCVTEVASWGILYYSLPASVEEITTDTGWSGLAVTGCFSAGLILSAAAGILVGRFLDRWGPRYVMTAGSALAVVGLVLVAAATTVPAFLAAWLVIGVAQAAVLYQPAFTVITRHYGAARDKPMLILTLAGGLASTIFVPITLALLAVLDWRATYLVLAGLLAAVTIPLHLMLPGARHSLARTPATADRTAHSRVITSRRFVLLVGGITAIAFSSYAVTLNLLPLVTERGYSVAVAALAFALVGVGQVVGRIGLTILTRSVSARYRPLVVGLFIAATVGLFAVVPGPVWMIAVVSTLAGAARGALTLVQATAVPSRWGTERLGVLNGAFAAPITALTAFAPVAGVAVATGFGSYAVAAAAFAGLAVVGAACVYLADRHEPWPVEEPTDVRQPARIVD
ncbi:putative MFS family arabinose efflux permease [Glaciihabitans tibetensis]|uniref:Putative MFS family arabinose efflux permease n=1 Tax=Glaciihabitans tibetensis TaxID=1266600 RepID=A0A2T0V5S2_9MICO|nr:MFS transporter [Glaciihabitans tibetensis]PRY65428.1 putative MFS family arabinose efflux permease [Glaciihabitans tibetensis]